MVAPALSPRVVDASKLIVAPPLPSQHFPAVDSLRAVAALAVLVFHVIAIGDWKSFPTTGPLTIFSLGGFWVSLFLVISGFVVTLAAQTMWRADPTNFHANFARRRLARIIPLYLITSVAALLLINQELVSRPFAELLGHIVAHLLFIHNWFPATHGSINGVNWSIALEMQFYVVLNEIPRVGK